MHDCFDRFKNRCITWKWIWEFRLFEFELQMCEGEKWSKYPACSSHHMCLFVCLLYFKIRFYTCCLNNNNSISSRSFNCFISCTYIKHRYLYTQYEYSIRGFHYALFFSFHRQWCWYSAFIGSVECAARVQARCLIQLLMFLLLFSIVIW